MESIVGRKAAFYFDGGTKIFGDILYSPVATGDCWIIQSYYDGKKDLVVYIQQFNYMALHPEDK